jgi:SAM-dependent methyltransferase
MTVAVYQDEPLRIVGDTVRRRFITPPVPQPQKLPVELGQSPCVGGVDGGVQQLRVLRHARLPSAYSSGRKPPLTGSVAELDPAHYLRQERAPGCVYRGPACEHGGVTRPDIRRQWNANAAAWTQLSRAGFDLYRDLVNTPAFFALLPPVDGLVCLDLGCGEGHNTRLLANHGARVAALDVAESFIAAATQADRSQTSYLVGDGAGLPFRASAFDAVTAFMSLMDVAEPERALDEVARVLRPGGFVQFSVLHPVISAPVGRWLYDESGVRQARAVGDYFYQGPLTETWAFSAAPAQIRDQYPPFTITYARRTLAGWMSAVLGVGLVIEAIAEPCADEETAAAHPQVADTRIAPYFLIVRARKP